MILLSLLLCGLGTSDHNIVFSSLCYCLAMSRYSFQPGRCTFSFFLMILIISVAMASSAFFPSGSSFVIGTAKPPVKKLQSTLVRSIGSLISWTINSLKGCWLPGTGLWTLLRVHTLSSYSSGMTNSRRRSGDRIGVLGLHCRNCISYRLCTEWGV